MEALWYTPAESTCCKKRWAPCGVVGDDGVGVGGAVTLDVVDGFGHDPGTTFTARIRSPYSVCHSLSATGSTRTSGSAATRERAAAQANAAFLHARGEQRQKLLRDGLMDQDGLDGIAGGGIIGLGVVDDVEGHVEVRGGVDVDVADAFGMAEHGDARVGLHVAHQLVGAARDHQIDEIVELAGVRPLRRAAGYW